MWRFVSSVLLGGIFANTFHRPAEGQSIVSVAGSTISNDGEPAVAVGLRYPTAVIADRAGNLIIADSFSNRVRRVDAQTGFLVTIAGNGLVGFTGDGGPATEAELHTPSNVAFDSSGNVLIVDSGNGRIRRVDRVTGVIRTVAGGGNSIDERVTATTASLSFPLLIDRPPGIAVDGDGNIFISEPGRHRVRKIDVASGLIHTIAGTGMPGFSGEGGSALLAQLNQPTAIAFDGAGNLFLADTENSCIRRIAADTAVITTVAGVGGVIAPVSTDGPATSTALARPRGVAIDRNGVLHIADSEGRKIRRVVDGAMTTIAGTGAAGPPRDGPALQANLSRPQGISFDSSGSLLIADAHDFRIRRLDANGTITTVAGNGTGGAVRDGGPAVAAGLFSPWYVAVDREGHVIFSDRINQRIRRIDRRTGRISTVAGNGIGGFVGTYSGDGGAARSAGLNRPLGVTVDDRGNIYIADTQNHAIRFVDASTGIITTIAGTGTAGGIEEGRAATETPLNFPRGLDVAPNGDVVFADTLNRAIRRLDRARNTISTVVCCFEEPTDVQISPNGDLFIADTLAHKVFRFSSGQLTTFAGTGIEGFSGDGGAAVLADMRNPSGLALDAAGNVYVADIGTRTVRVVSSADGIIRRIVGGGGSGFRDHGPALQAELGEPNNVAVAANGDLFVPDTSSNRVRAVFACVTISEPSLAEPADGADGVSTSPELAWKPVEGAFRYDVFLSTTNAPQTLVATDLTATVFKPSNLLAGVKYFWRVVAKGDPFCPIPSTTSSVWRSFTTARTCTTPSLFSLIGPANAAAGLAPPFDLQWTLSPGAGIYDVYLGASNPPKRIGSTPSTSFRVTDLSAGETYYWSVTARSACDSERTTSTEIRSFVVAGSCGRPSRFDQRSPAAGSMVRTDAVLQWSRSMNATSYDLYFGLSPEPPLYLADLGDTQVSISGLTAGATYFWRVVAKVGCDPASAMSTAVSSFTVETACRPPSSTTFRFGPNDAVTTGQTYVLAWLDARGLNDDGFYIVERSLTDSFETILDSQQTTGTSVSFVALQVGILFHRVRAVNSCNRDVSGDPSLPRLVTVSGGSPNVIFTVQPEGVVTALGEKLEDRRARFVVENIGARRVTVVVAREEIDSDPFFSIVDPRGGDSGLLTLEPGQPKELEIRFSGPPNDRAGSYQGIISLVSSEPELPITPYAFVSLSVGGVQTSTPEFRAAGARTEFVSFPGFSGDDSMRPPISVEIHNSGSTQMDLASEVGPELWLLPEPGWNSTPIPPRSSRTVRLFTRRPRALHASALPRYTYFKVRTRSGQSSQLLVQDNDASVVRSGRSVASEVLRTRIIPEVVTTPSAPGTRTYSVVMLTNLGSEALQTELIFTPAGADGFDASRVRRATILIPPNDVVTLMDPLRQLWSIEDASMGQVEVSTSPEKLGLLAVRSIVVTKVPEGGASSYIVPTVNRADGVRLGAPQEIVGVTVEDSVRSALTITETSGIDAIRVRVSVMDNTGQNLGERVLDVGRYSTQHVDEVVTAITGRSTVEAANVVLTALSGGGSALALVKLLDRVTGGGATLVSASVEEPTGASGFATSTNRVTRGSNRLRSGRQNGRIVQTFFIPAVITGPAPGSGNTLVTTVGFAAPLEMVSFRLTYREEGSTRTATLSLGRGQSIEYRNVLQDLFGVAQGSPSEGSILVEAEGRGRVYARLSFASPTTGRVTVAESLPILSNNSEAVTSSASPRPLYVDGLEQSIDMTRGTSWSMTLNEIGGANSRVVVRMYEAGNRLAPIAEKEFTLQPLQRVSLGNVFSALGLDEAMRRKDRVNVLLSVVLKSGSGAAAAVAAAIDQRTGDRKSYLLAPAGGTPFAAQRAVAFSAPPMTRRRAARH